MRRTRLDNNENGKEDETVANAMPAKRREVRRASEKDEGDETDKTNETGSHD